MKKTAVVLFAFMVLSACAARPQPVVSNPLDRYTELKPGISTVEDAKALLGDPSGGSDVGNGRVVVVWQQYQMRGVGVIGMIFNSADHKFVGVSSVTFNK